MRQRSLHDKQTLSACFERLKLTLEHSLPYLLPLCILTGLHPHKGMVILCRAPPHLCNNMLLKHFFILQIINKGRKKKQLFSAHLENAHPVPGAGLEGRLEGEAAGDGGWKRVRVMEVGEDHLGEGGRRGVSSCHLFVGLHAAELPRNMKLSRWAWLMTAGAAGWPVLQNKAAPVLANHFLLLFVTFCAFNFGFTSSKYSLLND